MTTAVQQIPHIVSPYETIAAFLQIICQTLRSCFSMEFFKSYIDARMDGSTRSTRDSLPDTPEVSPPVYLTREIPPSPPQSGQPHRTFYVPSYIQRAIGIYETEFKGTFIKNTECVYRSMDAIRDYADSIPYSGVAKCISVQDLPAALHSEIQTIQHSSLFVHIGETFPKHSILPINEMNQLIIGYGVHPHTLEDNGGVNMNHLEHSQHSMPNAECVSPENLPHIDGFFAFLPWCTVARCTVMIQGTCNSMFHLSGTEYFTGRGEYMVHDYNRTIYSVRPGLPICIETIPTIAVTLHFLVVPEGTPQLISSLYSRIHRSYSRWVSKLSLNTSNTFNDTNWLVRFYFQMNLFYMKVFIIGLYLYTLWSKLCGV
jgi:hypothetical protein